MYFFYNLGIHFFVLGLRLASLWNSKARAMIQGRKGWKKKIAAALPPKHQKRYWFHCASLGEFEMARPVIEQIQIDFPERDIIITFFSPSGFEQRKHFICTGVFYLPFDTRKNVKKWYELVQPDVVVFVKYEFWLQFMREGIRRNLELLAVSVLFREGQFFFEPWAQVWKEQLLRFRRIFVQNEASANAGREEGLQNIEIAGDIRFDRVLDTVSHADALQEIERFKGESPLLVCGSTWQQEEKFLFEYLSVKSWPLGWKWVIAPHDISKGHIAEIMERFADFYPICYSDFIQTKEPGNHKILVIDNVGLLSRVYRYGQAAIVGGAWGKGLHNILEAAAFGMPVLFGPKHQKFPEAAEGIDLGFCFSAKNYDEFEIHLNRMLGNVEWRNETAEKARNYIRENAGATEKVMEFLRLN